MISAAKLKEVVIYRCSYLELVATAIHAYPKKTLYL